MTIFLDMDGVFNIYAGEHRTYNTKMVHFEEDSVKLFNEILTEFMVNGKRLKLVISSSWRDDMDDLQRQLEKVGFHHWDKVIGRTAMTDKPRGVLIKEYLDFHPDDYVVFDDYVDNILPYVDKNRVIQVSAYTGIVKGHIDKMRELIRNPILYPSH